jgi:glycosyltransferase involved in cell wall biosynthesis
LRIVEQIVPVPVSSKPRLLYLVTEDWYFLSHRLPMACAAQRAGYEVHVATRVVGRGTEIESYGFRLHPLRWERGSANPVALLSIIGQVRALYRRINPDLVHHVALQPSLIGSLAAIGLPFRRVNALAGLGFGFTSADFKARMLRPILRMLLRLAIRNKYAATLVQNPDDRRAIEALGGDRSRLFLIPGSGVDTNAFTPRPEAPGQITVAFVGRLLADKGVHSLIAAHQLLASRGQNIQLIIAGDRDPANPASIPADEVEQWRRLPGVELPGHVSDIQDVWNRAHIAVLPSRREGLPKSLLEAASCGRPIVATDVPGSREIARKDVNAILVAPDDVEGLADAISRLAGDPALRKRFGEAGRRLVEAEFSSEKIGWETVALYDQLLGRSPS